MKAVKKIEISVLHKRTMPLAVYTMQGDTGREIECTVVDWDIPAGATARVWVVKPSKKVVYIDGNIMENSVVFSLTNQMLAESGVAICIIEFASGDDVVSSFPFNLCIDGSARGDGIPSENESTVLEGMFKELAQDAIKTLNEAKAEVHNVQTAAAESVKNIETIGKAQVDAIKEAGGGVEQALSNYFALRRNGLVFTTKIYKYATSTSPVGVKMNANEGMVCEASVGRTKGRDDYERYGLFHHFTCNFSVDENGFNHVDALEGQTGFTKYGKVQVGEVTMSAWFGIEDTADAVLYHYSDSQTELTPRPMKESINPDGTLSPFMIHAKYAAGDIDGMPYSSKGLAPANGCQAAQAKNPVSYTGMITYMHKLGGHYCGTTSWDLFYRQLMMIIKYATTHSQSIMAGCTSYDLQRMNLVAETDVSRVIVTKTQAAGYVVGSYVSIGEMRESTDRDRYNAHMHNLAYSVKILKIEDVDDVNAAIYVDAPEAFDTTLTTCISTMPWHSGSTDEVAGSDGSLGNNTSGKYAYKIQGIEACIGACEVLGNVVMDIVTGADGNPARDVYVCQDASTLSSNIATIRTNYRKAAAQVAYTAASWKYISEETTDMDLCVMIPTGVAAGSTTGFADGLYTDTITSGQREWLALGGLDRGTVSGLWFLSANYGWLNASWFIVSGVSPMAPGVNGRRQPDRGAYRKKYGIEQLMKYAKRRVSIESKIHNRTASSALAAA